MAEGKGEWAAAPDRPKQLPSRGRPLRSENSGFCAALDAEKDFHGLRKFKRQKKPLCSGPSWMFLQTLGACFLEKA